MPITIAPTVLGPVLKDEAFTETFVGSGGAGPYTFAITAGAVPTGLSLNGSTGELSGTPTVSGVFNFTIRATDSLAATGDQAYAFQITPPIYWYVCTRSSYPTAIPTVTASQGDFNRRTANAIAGVSKSRHQVGDLLARPVVKSIPNHLLCDGSAVARDAFPQLFTEIGTEWGPGNGTTTFNIPNLIGAAIPVPVSAPAQVITNTTVSSGGTVTEPTDPGETGGTRGGQVPTGGRFSKV